ncbi:MAG: T9SS-dependent M36 family metallopeptidase [Saprospiraceae bacterium]
MKLFQTCLTVLMLSGFGLQAQDYSGVIQRYMLENRDKLQLVQTDIENWNVSDQYLTRHNQVTHVYLQQTVNGLKIHNAISSVAIQNNEVKSFSSAFHANAAELTNVSAGEEHITPKEAVLQAANSVGITIGNPGNRNTEPNDNNEFVFDPSGDVSAPIKVSLLYQATDEDIRLAWNVELQTGSDWWNIRVDAISGEVLDKNNYTVYCEFYEDAFETDGTNRHIHDFDNQVVAQKVNTTPFYRVFPFPGESPRHVSHTLLSDPSIQQASPYGWHDVDGQPGAEYTITRGNNVYASEDRDDNNNPGYSPDGGASLNFDFPYTPEVAPVFWENAAITNLFYANNFMHDVTYIHGFDEAAGNFQENNYGNGGQDGDFVWADAQDGSGTNNANFSTPPDGNNGRMQMYIWDVNSSGGGDSMSINIPGNYPDKFNAPASNFGAVLGMPLTADVVLVDDGVDPTIDGCQPIINGSELAGKIALLQRSGVCTYPERVKAAQDAGAIAAIVMQNTSAPAFHMPGADPEVVIPSFMVSKAHGLILTDALVAGTLNVTLYPTCCNSDRDSDVDNGVIAHEFGHGISNRLTGGPSNTGCLGNEEQMGEGWSDFFALITTMQPTDTRFTARGIGTYVENQPPTGAGIRNKRYSTDMAVNNYTYGLLEQTSGQVHNIGEFWCTMLNDLTWDLIDQYGFEPDLTKSTGGNNIAMQLVLDGMKLQRCNPGFVDGRDGILKADEMNFGGANKCLIWQTFARRGLGWSADQGSSNDYADGVEAFDLPQFCMTATVEPLAVFGVDRKNSCLDLATFHFFDSSQNIVHEWLWDFGDGQTSTDINPVHTYAQEGSYTVTLMVTNNIGSNSLVKTDYINVSSFAPITVSTDSICAGQTATITANPNIAGNTAEWTDENGKVLFSGDSFTTPILTQTTTFYVSESEPAPIQHVGPDDFGDGQNHSSQFGGFVRFTAEKPLTIISVLVRAEGEGVREILLIDGFGATIASASPLIPDGDSRVELNFEVPLEGSYTLAIVPPANLYRTNNNASYPYSIPGLVSITGASGQNQSRYYYFYDWEIQAAHCKSEATPFTVNIIPGPVPDFSYAKTGLAVSFTNLTSGSPTSIMWDFGDGNTSTMPNPMHTFASIGTYTVTLTVSDGNCTTSFSQVVDFTSATTELGISSFHVAISPNPAFESARIAISGEENSKIRRIGLYSADGRRVRAYSLDQSVNSVFTLDLRGLSSGIYYVKVEAESGTEVEKLIINR